MTTPQTPLRPFLLAPAAGETLNVLDEKIRVLASAAATGGSCFVFIEESRPGVGPPLHRHARDDDFFYVLEGSYRFRVDGRDHDAPAGTFVFVPKGTQHTFANVGASAGRLFIVTLPPMLEGAFRDCHAGKLTPADGPRLGEVFAKVGITIEGPPLVH